MEIDIRFVTLKCSISLLDNLRVLSNGLLTEEVNSLESILQKPMLMMLEDESTDIYELSAELFCSIWHANSFAYYAENLAFLICEKFLILNNIKLQTNSIEAIRLLLLSPIVAAHDLDGISSWLKRNSHV